LAVDGYCVLVQFAGESGSGATCSRSAASCPDRSGQRPFLL